MIVLRSLILKLQKQGDQKTKVGFLRIINSDGRQRISYLICTSKAVFRTAEIRTRQKLAFEFFSSSEPDFRTRNRPF